MKLSNKVVFLSIFMFCASIGLLVKSNIVSVLLSARESKLKELPLDPKNRVSAFFESKLFINEQEYPWMSLSSIVGDDMGYGLVNIGSKNLLYGIKTYKTADCSENELYAEFHFGEWVDKKPRIYSKSAVKVKNRVQSTVDVLDPKYGEKMRLVVKPFFGPAKNSESAMENKSLQRKSLNSKYKTIPQSESIYSVSVVQYKDHEILSKAGVIVSNNQEASIEQKTERSVRENLNKTLKIKVNKVSDDSVFIDAFYLDKEEEREDVHLIQQEISLNKEIFFNNRELSIKVAHL